MLSVDCWQQIFCHVDMLRERCMVFKSLRQVCSATYRASMVNYWDKVDEYSDHVNTIMSAPGEYGHLLASMKHIRDKVSSDIIVAHRWWPWYQPPPASSVDDSPLGDHIPPDILQASGGMLTSPLITAEIICAIPVEVQTSMRLVFLHNPNMTWEMSLPLQDWRNVIVPAGCKDVGDIVDKHIDNIDFFYSSSCALTPNIIDKYHDRSWNWTKLSVTMPISYIMSRPTFKWAWTHVACRDDFDISQGKHLPIHWPHVSMRRNISSKEFFNNADLPWDREGLLHNTRLRWPVFRSLLTKT